MTDFRCVQAFLVWPSLNFVLDRMQRRRWRRWRFYGVLLLAVGLGVSFGGYGSVSVGWFELWQKSRKLGAELARLQPQQAAYQTLWRQLEPYRQQDARAKEFARQRDQALQQLVAILDTWPSRMVLEKLQFQLGQGYQVWARADSLMTVNHWMQRLKGRRIFSQVEIEAIREPITPRTAKQGQFLQWVINLR